MSHIAGRSLSGGMHRGKGDVTVSLTVKDILEKTFQRSFKGYNEDEVDQFLDQVIDEFKRLLGEVKTLEGRNAQLSSALEQEKKHRNKIKDTEATIMNTLVSAQKSSERIMNDAARKAEMIIASAENTAKQSIAQTEQQLLESEAKLEEIKHSARDFAAEFTNMVNATAAAFSEKYRASFGEGVPSGINAAALNKINREVADSLKDIVSDIQEEAEELPADAAAEAPAEDIAVIAETPEEDVVEAPDEDITDTPAVNIAEAPADVPEKETAEASEEDVAEAPADVPEPEKDVAEAPAEDAAKAVDKPKEDDPKTGLMELHEINKALSELENEEDILSEDDGSTDGNDLPKDSEKNEDAKVQFSDYKQKYNDYSWLYENDGQQDMESSLKEPADKDELKSLIDEIID